MLELLKMIQAAANEMCDIATQFPERYGVSTSVMIQSILDDAYLLEQRIATKLYTYDPDKGIIPAKFG
jgi:hypothetical protein